MSEDEYKAYILKHFHYNADGTLTRTDRRNGNGSLDKDGYLIIKVKGKRFKAHRIVWLIHHGNFPALELDHINRVRTDNRIENLREATRKEQVLNTTRLPNTKTGVIGITRDDKTKGLLAKYTFKIGKKCYRFRTLEQAITERERLNDIRKVI